MWPGTDGRRTFRVYVPPVRIDAHAKIPQRVESTNPWSPRLTPDVRPRLEERARSSRYRALIQVEAA